MSLFGSIKNILSPLQIPVFRLTGKSQANQYITVMEYNQQGSLYADDEEQNSRSSIQINLYSKVNFEETTKQIKNLLLSAGLNKTNEFELYEDETGYYNKVIRFYFDQENGGND